MTYGSVRRRIQAQELDREQWASNLETVFRSLVVGVGEYLTDPIYFGRAYEGPPRLDWDATLIEGWTTCPNVTVGVAEWIKDSQDAYIGARLWIKIPCQLWSGCQEVIATGDNVLLDPSFELQYFKAGTLEIPQRNYTDTFEEQLILLGGGTTEFLPYNKTAWSVDGAGWTLVEGDALDGQYFARWTGTNTGPYLNADQHRMCRPGPRVGSPHDGPLDVEPWLHTAQVQPNDRITVSFWARGSGHIQSVLSFWTSIGGFQSGVPDVGIGDGITPTGLLAGSWQEFGFEFVMPDDDFSWDVRYARWGVRGITDATQVDIDKCSVGIER